MNNQPIDPTAYKGTGVFPQEKKISSGNYDQKIEDIKEQIKNGTYSVSYYKLATNLLSQGFLEL